MTNYCVSSSIDILVSEVNECDSGPCMHGACTNQLNYYDCTCDAGWTGSHCSQGKIVVNIKIVGLNDRVCLLVAITEATITTFFQYYQVAETY